jgi:hypothetical protein
MPTLLLALLLSTLGNADIVKLVKAGLSAETIEAKIAASETKFDTSTDALVALASDGVPDRVIRAMIGAKPAAAPARAAAQTAAPARRVTKAAARRFTSRRYEVTLLGANGGKCEGELRIDGNGIKATRCGTLDFELPWSAVTRPATTTASVERWSSKVTASRPSLQPRRSGSWSTSAAKWP